MSPYGESKRSIGEWPRVANAEDLFFKNPDDAGDHTSIAKRFPNKIYLVLKASGAPVVVSALRKNI